MLSGALRSGSARLPSARRSATASRPSNNLLTRAYRGFAQHIHAFRNYTLAHSQSVHLKSRSGVRSLPVPVLRQPPILRSAARRREDDYVELDDEDRWSDQVEIAVKAGLVLLAVAVARSLLGVALTLGTVVFGAYVAAKLWSKQDPPGQSSSQPARRGRKSRRQSTDDDGLSDVWFENKPKRIQSKKRADDTFW